MRLIDEQINSYKKNGFLFLPSYFSELEVEIMKSQVPTVFAEDTPERVVEKDGALVRSVYGSHQKNEVFRRLSRHPRIIDPVKKALGSDVYVYQFKINAKVAFAGDVWEWHQDYIYWLREDGMPAPRVVNAFIFLDEVNEFNGPLFLIPGSHAEGVIDVRELDIDAMRREDMSEPYHERPSWIFNLTAKLKYALDCHDVARLVRQYGIIAPKGPSGSLLLVHPNIVHASPNNISPFDRTLVIITYNSVDNVPASSSQARPEFLVSRACEPVESLPDNALFI